MKNLTSSLNKLINKPFLKNIVVFIAILNVFGYMNTGRTESVIIFFLLGFLFSLFSKNTIGVLLLSIVLTNMICGRKLVSMTPLLEGMGNCKKQEPQTKTDNETDDLTDDETDSDDEDTTKSENEPECNCDAIPDSCKKKCMVSTIKPAEVENDSDNDNQNSFEIAFDNITADAIKKMKIDSQNLVQKQEKLMGSLDKLQPIIKKAQEISKTLDNMRISSLMKQYLS